MKKYILFFFLWVFVGHGACDASASVTTKTNDRAAASSQRLRRAATLVRNVNRVSRPTVKAPVASQEEEQEAKAESDQPTAELRAPSAEEQAKAAKDARSKAIDDFLKDEEKVRDLLGAMTDKIGLGIVDKTMTDQEVQANVQEAVNRLQEAYVYYYSGFMSADVADRVETWTKDLLDKIDKAFITSAQQSVATSN